MSLQQKCRLIHGADSYCSRQALHAIEQRFLSRAESMVDFIKLDLEETTLDQVKQIVLTIPFLVTHRLFVLKNCFSLPKADQEGLMTLLEQLGESTYVILYESKSCDKKLTFYKWAEKQCRIEAYDIRTDKELIDWIQHLTKKGGVSIDNLTTSQLLAYTGKDSWRIKNEVLKLVAYARAQDRDRIASKDISILIQDTNELSLFALTDALRDGAIKKSVALYREISLQQDPMMIAGMIAGQIRSWTKIHLCLETGIHNEASIARYTKLNPYVIKLSLPFVRQISSQALKAGYSELIRFEEKIKSGATTPALSLLLLILRLHGSLFKKVKSS